MNHSMFFPRSFFLLLAPPAWGKTRLFHQWLADEARPFLYISPLRALAEEVKRGVGQRPGHVEWKGTQSLSEWAAPAEHARVLVVTPEQLGELPWLQLAVLAPDAVVVWDEVHLIQLWGESFRERLLECWWGFSESGLCGVGLTATASEEFMLFLRATWEGLGTTLILGDAGNYQFRWEPRRWLRGPEGWLARVLEASTPEGNTLVFVRHRHEVDQWVARLRAQGQAVVGCKGGETLAFSQSVSQLPCPVFIIATSCLSHGVNLPRLERVVLLYHEADPALFHQMVTRGGRRGEAFEVWHPWRREFGVRGHWKSWAWLASQVVVAQFLLFMGEWWNGSRGHRHSDRSPERA